jgi:hypothetical protein
VRCVRLSFAVAGLLAMTDWTGIGSGPLLAGLLLACWFGFLLWLLYFAATTPP